jgi:hypothetical protein
MLLALCSFVPALFLGARIWTSEVLKISTASSSRSQPGPAFPWTLLRPFVPIQIRGMSIEFRFLSDYAHALPTVADWYFGEWSYLGQGHTLEQVKE